MVSNIYIFDDTVTNDGENRHDQNRGNDLFKVIREIKTNKGFDFSINSFDQVYPNHKPSCDCNVRYCNDKCSCCNKNQEFRTANDDSIIFIHTSNQCFYGFTKQFVGNDKHWIVCYSGGGQSSADAYNDLRRDYPDAKNIAFFGLSPSATAEDIKRLWNLEVFIEAVISNKGNPFEYLVPKVKTHLINLYPLCLGYLDAHSKAITNKEITESENWWKAVLGNDLNGVELKKELRELKEAESVVDNLISRIKAINSVSDEKSREAAVNALTEIVEMLKGLCHELEKSGRLL